MKTKLVVAGLLALAAAATFGSTASAQCVFPYPDPGNPMIIANGNDNQWAFETNYTYINLGGTAGGPRSTAGSLMTAGGTVTNFCAPFLDLDPSDPGQEYTWIITGTSMGTVTSAFGGGGSRHDTQYSGVTFAIYSDPPGDAPALPPNPRTDPPVPTNYANGTAILTGTISNFLVIQSRLTATGTWSSSVNGNATFTGGTLFDRVGPGSAIYTGTWCPAGGTGCYSLASGYSSRPKAKWDSPPTVDTHSSTWGAIKQLYR